MDTILHNLKSKMIVLFSLISMVSFSQNGFNYQGVAIDLNDNLMMSIEITLDINIKKTTKNGVTIYKESHTITTDAIGAFSIVIGQGQSEIIPYSEVDWEEGKYYLNVNLDSKEIGTIQFFGALNASAIGKRQAHENRVNTKRPSSYIYIGGESDENDNFISNNNIGFGKGGAFIKNTAMYDAEIDKCSVSYTELIKAIQEQNAIIKQKSKELLHLKERINNIEVLLSKVSIN